MMDPSLAPIHPGEFLLEDFMKPLGLSQNKLARDIGVPTQRIHQIVKGERGITADTALRLSAYFNTTPGLWLGLQQDYELEAAAMSGLAERIKREVRPRAGLEASAETPPARATEE